MLVHDKKTFDKNKSYETLLPADLSRSRYDTLQNEQKSDNIVKTRPVEQLTKEMVQRSTIKLPKKLLLWIITQQRLNKMSIIARYKPELLVTLTHTRV